MAGSYSGSLFNFFFKVFYLIELLYNYNLIELIYNVFLLYRKVIQLYRHTYFFHIIFHYTLLKDIEYSSLCYTVGPSCLFILYIIVCIR